MIHFNQLFERKFERVSYKFISRSKEAKTIEKVDQYIKTFDIQSQVYHLTEEEQKKLSLYMDALHSIAEVSKKLIPVYYHYLREKVDFFVQTASVDELRIFMNICKKVL